MRIHLLEHETEGISINIIDWSLKNKHPLSRTYVPKAITLPAISDFELLIIAGGPQHIWAGKSYSADRNHARAGLAHGSPHG